MTSVLLLSRNPQAETEPLARLTVRAPGEPAEVEVLLEADRTGIELMIADGVPDGNGNLLTVADGEAFLDGLVQRYQGSRLWAEYVDTDET
jgi:hypothetical protein